MLGMRSLSPSVARNCLPPVLKIACAIGRASRLVVVHDGCKDLKRRGSLLFTRTCAVFGEPGNDPCSLSATRPHGAALATRCEIEKNPLGRPLPRVALTRPTPSLSVGNPASFQVASRLPPREGPSTVINRQASVDRVVVDIGLTGLTTGGVVRPIARHSDLGRSRIQRRSPRVQICATPGRRNLAEGEAAARTCSGLCPAVRRRV